MLLSTTLVLPLITGALAVILGFGDPWGMGADDAAQVFVTAALPFLPPGLNQMIAWPSTYGLALVLVPLAAARGGRSYLLTMSLYLVALALTWSIGWAFAPDRIDTLIDGISHVPGRLNSNLVKLGVYVLTDAGTVAATIAWWRWR